MKPDHAARSTLAAVIAADLESIKRLDSELAELEEAAKSEQPGYRDLAAAAYTLHNIYTAFENSFEQISRTFENHIVDVSHWHKELLNKMLLDIPEVRPHVLPAKSRKLFNDLRGFRHVFRHSYHYEIDPRKLSILIEEWNAGKKAVYSTLEDFRTWLLRR